MNAAEAGKLLTIYAGTTGREVTAGMAHGMAMVLPDMPYTIGEAALAEFLRSPEGGFALTPAMLQKYAVPILRRLARDVRSAKLRGWIPDSWPAERPLPDTVRQRFKREFEQTNDYPDALDGDTGPAAIEGGA